MIFITDKCDVRPYGTNFLEVELDIDESEALEQCDKGKILELMDRDFIKKALNLREDE